MLTRIFLLTLLLASLLFARQLYVPNEFLNIQDAINSSVQEDTIFVSPGHYYETLSIPPIRLSLFSLYIQSGDPNHILNTVIDASYFGTAVYLQSGPNSDLTISGFSILHGSGQSQNDFIGTGGAFHFESATSCTIENIILNENEATTNGSIMFTSGADRMNSLSVSNVDINLIGGMTPSGNTKIPIQVSSDIVIIDNVDFSSSIGPSRAMKISADSIIFNSVDIDSFYSNTVHQNGSNGYQIRLSAIDYLRCDSLRINNCSSNDGPIFIGITGVGNIVSNGILFTNNRNVSDCLEFSYRNGATIVMNSADSLYLHDSKILGNHSKTCYSAGWFEAETHGYFENVEINANHSGDATAIETDCLEDGKCIKLINMDISNISFCDNVSTLFDIEQSDGEFGLREKGLGIDIELTHSGHYEYNTIIAEYNIVVDSDDYNQNNIMLDANIGRSMLIECKNIYGVCDIGFTNCDFINNLQDNCAPEYDLGIFNTTRSIGSTVEIRYDYEFVNNKPRLEVDGVSFIGNDDGALMVYGARNVTINQCYFNDNKRSSISISTDSIRANNVYIGSTVLESGFIEEPFLTSSNQRALSIVASIDGAISNFTLDSNRAYFLLSGYSTDYPQVIVENSIISNDSCRMIFNPGDGWNQYNPFLMDYCYLPLNMQGNNSIIGNNPGYSDEFGVPYLSANSPCIDEGNPNLMYDDVEDPLQPMSAKWPSQGSIRNDIGFTGGPHATVLDTNWVAVQPWEPSSQPQDFSLGAPWPNPFNPMTRIPFTLIRSLPVRLSVHNLLGQDVAVLVNQVLPAGIHQAVFRPGKLASGLYLVTLEAANRSETRTITLLR